MRLQVKLVVWVFWYMPVGYLAAQAVLWPPDVLEDKGFRNMLLTSDGQHLIVSGLNGVYVLNTTDFQLLNQAVTGPSANYDDIITIMIYNRTETDNDGYITTCSSRRNYCDIREVNDISRSVNHLNPPIKIDGAEAFMATYIKTSGRNRRQDFLFIGCPHVEGQGDLGGRCTKPGISWYLNSGGERSRPWYGFKSYEETPVLTEKYIGAFSVDNYRIFFSVQGVKATGKRRSRIAQVCQYYVPHFHTYSTPNTYADMPVQCGQLKEIRAVKNVVVGTETLFITVFSGPMKSAVCIYTMENIKSMFVANIKDCYRGGRAPANQDYINFQTSNRPCTQQTIDNSTFYMPEDYYLCNKDNLALFHQVIGSKVLSSLPVVQFDTQLTAVTVSQIDSKIVAFLGTTSGEILKAVVYPKNSAVRLKQLKIKNLGYMIKQDMYTSHDGKHIFVLSQRQVYKEPVESCSGFPTCASCLGSRDPYCGWCFLENRCGTRNICTEWISVSSNEKCPHVISISPTVMSDKEIVLLNIEVSHALLEGVRVSCDFFSDEIGEQFHHNVTATVSDGGKTVRCRPTNILAIEDSIKGFSNVTVAILANDSDTQIHGNFIVYRCETFDRCTGCIARNWTCKWCTYSNQCIDNDRSCNDNDLEVNFGECPRVTGYTMVSDDSFLRDANSTVYLSQDSSYDINITGTNLPVPRSGPTTHVSYKCKIVASGSHILWLNSTVFDKGGSIICKINKEEMASIPGLIGRLSATVHVTWGISPVNGDTLPVVIYDCENLVKPSNNCGRCKSFANYQPYLHCQWCMTRCIDSGISCNAAESECDDPKISRVHPLSAHVNASTLIEIEGVNLGSAYNDTINAVTIAGIPCTSDESSYDPGMKIMCELSPSYKVLDGRVVVTLSNNATGHYTTPFHFRIPEVTYVEPSLGPLSGGTSVTIYGKYLDTGREKTITIGEIICKLNANEEGTVYPFESIQSYNDIRKGKDLTKLECNTTSGDPSKLNKPLDMTVAFDGVNVTVSENITYRYVADPNITAILPRKSFQSGGRRLTVKGTNLNSIQKPKIYAVLGSMKMKSEECIGDDKEGAIYCPSPKYRETEMKRKKRTSGPVQAKLGFEMDDVSSVTADNLPNDLAILMYYPDPVLENFTEVNVYKELKEYLVIKGKGLKLAADENDVTIEIECEKCNVTSITNEAIICEPPTEKPVCGKLKDHKLFVTVRIGYFTQIVGYIAYFESEATTASNMNTVLLVVVLILILFIGIGGLLAYRRLKAKINEERNKVVFRKSETAEPDEQRITSTVSYAYARDSSDQYDFIPDAAVVNTYLELNEEDPTYTKADEYADPHPYRRLDNVVDQSEIKSDIPVNVDPENELENDLIGGNIYPKMSQNNENVTFEESGFVADSSPDIDGGYIHPIGSQEFETGKEKCERKLETARGRDICETATAENEGNFEATKLEEISHE
ncbi:plexin-B-like [Mercenaria mercenaria]|uniref:plexin-B-like n=1 Tax=Mercenaria mercenaria TaxID=6596 RepID=UPI00234F9E44|nr:plexin-B-like [Mercenaria mercenaria]XP_053391295.1 plexin-B-like [Mercenaria mercenaria]